MGDFSAAFLGQSARRSLIKADCIQGSRTGLSAELLESRRVAEDIDPLAILAALDLAAPRAVTAVSGGWDTSLWRVDNGDRAFALRVFRPDQAEMCAREAVVMRALARAGLPVPGRRYGGQRTALAGALDRVVQRDHGPGARAAPADERLASWRRNGPCACGHSRLSGARCARGGGARVGRREVIHTARPGNLPGAVQDLPAALHTEVRRLTRARRALLHLDYHPLNVMCQGPRITGVLDWANARLGDPRADLARTITLLRLAPTPPGTRCCSIGAHA